ncbi:unnamed protein product [Chrysoparadoxa australica]
MSSLGVRQRAGDVNPSLTVFVKDLRSPHSRKRPLVVRSWSSVKDLKDSLASLLNIPSSQQRLFYRGRELRNQHLLQDCGIYQNGATIFFAIARDVSQQKYALELYQSLRPPRGLLRLVNHAKRALDLGFAPTMALEGTGGTYFLSDTRKRKLLAFKPQDEEPFTPNNPRGFEQNFDKNQVCMRPGVRPGEACVREVAAYLLDKGHFSSIPATTLVEARHPAFCYRTGKEVVKLGSLQEFVHHDEVVSDISPSKLSTHQVHKIAILDMRLLNTDRNDANILVRRKSSSSRDNRDGSRGDSSTPHWSSLSSISSPSSSSYGALLFFTIRSPWQCSSFVTFVCSSHPHRNPVRYELIPIDHGYILPEVLEVGWCDWCWLDWPQLKQPLDDECKKFIRDLSPAGDAEWISNKLALRDESLVNFQAASMLLQEGVKADLNLYEIASIVVRVDLDKKSGLERLMDRADDLARAAAYNNTSPGSQRGSSHKTTLVTQSCTKMDSVPFAVPFSNATLGRGLKNLERLTSGRGRRSSHASHTDTWSTDTYSSGDDGSGMSGTESSSSGDGIGASGGKSPVGFWRESFAAMDAKNKNRPLNTTWSAEMEKGEVQQLNGSPPSLLDSFPLGNSPASPASSGYDVGLGTEDDDDDDEGSKEPAWSVGTGGYGMSPFGSPIASVPASGPTSLTPVETNEGGPKLKLAITPHSPRTNGVPGPGTHLAARGGAKGAGVASVYGEPSMEPRPCHHMTASPPNPNPKQALHRQISKVMEEEGVAPPRLMSKPSSSGLSVHCSSAIPQVPDASRELCGGDVNSKHQEAEGAGACDKNRSRSSCREGQADCTGQSPKQTNQMSQSQSLYKPVKIVRSHSYNGMRSKALYDQGGPAHRGAGGTKARRIGRPSKLSEEYKKLFFDFLAVLIRDTTNRLSKQCPERGNNSGGLRVAAEGDS